MDIRHFDTCGDRTPGHDHALVVIGGHPPDRRVLAHLPPADHVICADSGLGHALRLGLSPTAVVGDMDSVDAESLEAASSLGCSIVRHPTDKDLTDTEIALCCAVDVGCRQVSLVWGGGDRIDHVLGVIAALGHPRLGELDSLAAWLAADRIDVLHAGRGLLADGRPGTTVSLIPIGSERTVVSTSGLKWNLLNAALESTSARGVSNVVVDGRCHIDVSSGVAAVVWPGRLDDGDASSLQTRSRRAAVSTSTDDRLEIR